MSSLAQRISQIEKATLFVTEFFQDIYIYARYCGVSPFQVEHKKLYYKLIIETHAIEKGLSLGNPRMLFGRQKVPAIIRQVKQYGIGSSDLPVLMAVGAMQAYLETHRAAGIADPLLDEIEMFLSDRSLVSTEEGTGGLRHFPDGLPQQDAEAASLLRSRFSCRTYAPEALDRKTLERIVVLAQTAPSQCNRQATKLHFYSDRKMICELLTLQAGSGGFAENVNGLIIVSFDLVAWGGAQQRNQGYVDASLFAMNFMLGAHALGVASCPLNLAIRHSTERRIKQVGGIPNDQRLVMMIALGWPTRGMLKAAASPRRPMSEILSIIEAPPH